MRIPVFSITLWIIILPVGGLGLACDKNTFSSYYENS